MLIDECDFRGGTSRNGGSVNMDVAHLGIESMR